MGLRLFAAFLCLSTASPLLAQSPAVNDELKATMRVMAPDATDPGQVLGKIPPRKPKRPAVDDDSPADDLANPGGNSSQDESGSAVDPGVPTAPVPASPIPTTDPVVPAEPGLPVVQTPDIPVAGSPGNAPDPRERPGDFGHQVTDGARNHGEDARRHGENGQGHHDDRGAPGKGPKPPENKPPQDKPPGGKPPANKPPDRQPPRQQPPAPRPPDRDPPGHRPRDREPPGHQPRDPPRDRPDDHPKRPRG